MKTNWTHGWYVFVLLDILSNLMIPQRCRYLRREMHGSLRMLILTGGSMILVEEAIIGL
jgi:hypothetical protein